MTLSIFGFQSRSATVLLALLLLSFQAVTAQQGFYEVEYEFVKTSAQPAKLLLDANEWRQYVSSDKANLLDSGTLTSTFGEECLNMSGLKVPIPYRDPRVDGYQVQYIDEGFKLDCTATPHENGMIKVVTRVGKSSLSPDAASAYGQDTFLCDTTILLRRGQTAILTTTKGLVTKQYLSKVYPGTTFGENETVLLAITIR